MADADDVRRLAGALPHVVEVPSEGFDFRVGDKGFVWSYPERRPGRPGGDPHRRRRAVRGRRGGAAGAALGEPDAFFTAGYEAVPLVLLRLDESTPSAWRSS